MLCSHMLFEEIKPKIISTDEHIKYFFPMLCSSLKGHLEFIFPLLTSVDADDTKYLNTKISGMNTDIYLNNIVDPNAWTIPGVSKVIYAQFLAVPIANTILLISSILNLLKNKIEYKVNGKNLKFTTTLDCLMWQTRGLKTYVQDPELRYAIWLHEIGHWVKFENTTKILLLAPFTAIPGLNLIALLIIIALMRANERKADMFVKEVGYGKELSSALEILGYGIVDNATFLLKVDKYIEVAFAKIHDVIDKFIPLTNHPSFKTRISDLQDTYITIYGQNILYESILQDTIYPLIKKLIEPIDKLFSDNAQIFNKKLA